MGTAMFYFYLFLIVPVALLFYLVSVSTRRRYRCPECGERVQIEWSAASRCGLCGSELKEEA